LGFYLFSWQLKFAQVLVQDSRDGNPAYLKACFNISFCPAYRLCFPSGIFSDEKQMPLGRQRSYLRKISW
jgi:hypothetical protein